MKCYLVTATKKHLCNGIMHYLYICKTLRKEMLSTEQQLQMAFQLIDNNIALL